MKMHNFAIAILGSDGFIGSHVVQFCQELGVPVVELPRWDGNPGKFDQQINKLKSLNPEIPIYLLQTAWYSTSNSDYRTSSKNNDWVEISTEMVKICKQHQIIFAGLGTCLEKQSINHDLYTSSKLQIQKFLQSQNLIKEWIWFQPHYVYSKDYFKPFVLRKAAEALAAGVPLTLGTPGDRHDFIEVRDVADALVHSLSSGLRGVIEIGTGKTIEVSHLLRELFPTLELDEGSQSAKQISYQGAAVVDKLMNSGWKPRFSAY